MDIDLKKIFMEVLEEYWRKLLELAPKLVMALVVLAVFYYLSKRVSGFIKARLMRTVSDALLVRFLSNMARYIVVIIGFIMAMDVMGLAGLASGLVAGAGLSAFVIGFAFKDIGENFLSGIILAFSRPFRVGDLIEVNGIMGTVESMELRSLHVKTLDGRDIILPNSMVLNNPLVNYHKDDDHRFEFVVNIDYTDDIEKAQRILVETIEAHPMVEKDQYVWALVDTLNANGVDIKCYYWLDYRTHFDHAPRITSEIILAAKNRLLEEGLNITYDTLELRWHDQSNPFQIRKVE